MPNVPSFGFKVTPDHIRYPETLDERIERLRGIRDAAKAELIEADSNLNQALLEQVESCLPMPEIRKRP